MLVEEPLTDGEKEEAFEAILYIEIAGPQGEEENPLAIVMSKTHPKMTKEKEQSDELT